MKIVQINVTCGIGSTGKICLEVSKLLTEKGIENYILYSSGKSDYPLGIKYTSDKYIKLQALKSRIFGNYGFTSKRATKKLIKKLDEIKPDIIHLHNLHGHNVHLEMLLDYIRENNIKTFWTFHDCWTFTGYCPHYAMVKCDKWKTGCHNCIRCKEFSWFFDRSEKLYKKKKEATKNLDLTIITPSNWLADQVKESFLKDYPVKVINNGIDLDVFKPTESDFKKNNCLENKKIVLGVAFDWGVRKGLDVFVELAKRLPQDYQIVLVGTNDNVDKQLPNNIISIHRTHNQRELAEIYTASDVFVNPTREENYPTVNMEAIACGTPVVTFRTGGSPEMLDDKTGIVVDCDDIEKLVEAIAFVCENNSNVKEFCHHKSKQFNKNDRFQDYIDLYME